MTRYVETTTLRDVIEPPIPIGDNFLLPILEVRSFERVVLQWTQRDASVSPGAAGGHRGALAHGRSGGPVLGREWTSACAARSSTRSAMRRATASGEARVAD